MKLYWRCACTCPSQAVNEKPQIIQEYESGKAIPNPQVLSKLSRILGVQLKKWIHAYDRVSSLDVLPDKCMGVVNWACPAQAH